jgi:hypothetical protein
MTKLPAILAAVLTIQAAALAADPALLSLLMPDAKAVAGVQVTQARTSPFGQYVLKHMQPDDPAFLKFLADTNFDPRRDLSEIVIASNATTDVSSHFMVVARGTFDAPKILAASKKNGAIITSSRGISMIRVGEETQIAFLDATTAIMGDAESTTAAIGRFLNKNQPSFSSSTYVPQVQNLSAANDFWFLTLVPLSEFSGIMTDPSLGQAMNGNMFQAITQASGGIKFGPNVQVGLRATARTEKDAQALADVVRFIGGLIQTNKDKTPAGGEAATLVDTMKLDTTGNTTTMSLSIPEAVMEHLFSSERAQQRAARKPPVQ